MGTSQGPSRGRSWNPSRVWVAIVAVAAAVAGVLTADGGGATSARVPRIRPGPSPSFVQEQPPRDDGSSTDVVLRGRLADERFQGFPGLAQAFADGQSLTGAGCVRDDRGFVVRATAPARGSRCLIVLSPFDGIAAFATAFDPIVALRSPADGPLDVGVVPRGGEGPVCVRGRVVDDQGLPLAGVRLSVVLLQDRSTFNLRLRTSPSGADGGFVWRAQLHGDLALRLEAAPPFSATRPVECRPGATDVTVRVHRSFAREIGVALPPGFAAEGLVVQISGPGARLDGSVHVENGAVTLTSSHMEFPAAQRTRLTGLAAGPYDLILRRKGTSATLGEIRGWEPEFGDPPPLTPDSAVAQVEVAVVGPDGAAVPGARVWLRESGRLDRFGGSVTADAAGRVAIPRSRPGGTVAATAPGMDFAFAPADGAEVTLELRAARPTEIVVRLPRGTVRPGGDVTCGLRVRWAGEPEGAAHTVDEDEDPRAESSFDATFDADGEARVVVPVAGWYDVCAMTQRGTSRTWWSPGGPFRVRVDGTGTRVEATAPDGWKHGFDE